MIRFLVLTTECFQLIEKPRPRSMDCLLPTNCSKASEDLQTPLDCNSKKQKRTKYKHSQKENNKPGYVNRSQTPGYNKVGTIIAKTILNHIDIEPLRFSSVQERPKPPHKGIDEIKFDIAFVCCPLKKVRISIPGPNRETFTSGFSAAT